jgi:hypothetical protein
VYSGFRYGGTRYLHGHAFSGFSPSSFSFLPHCCQDLVRQAADGGERSEDQRIQYRDDDEDELEILIESFAPLGRL